MKAKPRNFTPKQMGDACEMLIAAELTLAGVPAMKGPDYWPGYDVIAQPPKGEPQRVSVKSRHFKRGAAFVEYDETYAFEWLAIVILLGQDESRRRSFIVPRVVADLKARRNQTGKNVRYRYFRIDEVATKLREFENNFTLAAVFHQH